MEAGAEAEPGHAAVTSQPVESEPVELAPPAHPPLPRRFPISVPAAVLALVFVAVMTLPFIGVFGGIWGDDDIAGLGPAEVYDGPSLIKRDRFGRALAKVKGIAGPEASLVAFRLAPDRIDALVRKSNGQRASIQVLADLTVRTFDAAGSGGPRGLSLNRIRAAVPERIVRAGAERLRASRDDISYMVLSSIPSLGGGGIWSVFFTGGGAARYVIADLDGSNVRRPGQ